MKLEVVRRCLFKGLGLPLKEVQFEVTKEDLDNLFLDVLKKASSPVALDALMTRFPEHPFVVWASDTLANRTADPLSMLKLLYPGFQYSPPAD